MSGASYAAAGVDVEAGERAVALMRASVAAAQRPETVGSFGGFAGLFDASALTKYRKPLLATYEPDKRTMAKIKHERTADCVVAGYRTHKSGDDLIGSLLLGPRHIVAQRRAVVGVGAVLDHQLGALPWR